jgi:hypothetical protein
VRPGDVIPRRQRQAGEVDDRAQERDASSSKTVALLLEREGTQVFVAFAAADTESFLRSRAPGGNSGALFVCGRN